MSQFTFIEEDKLAEYELLEKELKWYKDSYSELNDLIDKLTDVFLGPDWYIADPVNTRQANEIIVDEIIRKFAPRKREKKSPLRRYLDGKRKIH